MPRYSTTGASSTSLLNRAPLRRAGARKPAEALLPFAETWPSETSALQLYHEALMWMQLNHPLVLEQIWRSCPSTVAPFYAALLGEAAQRPWAAEVAVVASHEALRLTTRLEHGDPIPAGSLSFAPTGDGAVAFHYHPPHPHQDMGQYTAPLAEALEALELMLIRLFEDHGTRPPEEASADTDQDAPRHGIGQWVRVCESARHRTVREGLIVERIWHHRFGCWMYYIEERDGRRVSTRYLAEDLERLVVAGEWHRPMEPER